MSVIGGTGKPYLRTYGVEVILPYPATLDTDVVEVAVNKEGITGKVFKYIRGFRYKWTLTFPYLAADELYKLEKIYEKSKTMDVYFTPHLDHPYQYRVVFRRPFEVKYTGGKMIGHNITLELETKDIYHTINLDKPHTSISAVGVNKIG